METARMTAMKNNFLDDKLRKEMKKCTDAYLGYEGEICALKKIRGELYKIKGGGHSAFFQDCEVPRWAPEECTAECAGGTMPDGGTQIITRKVLNGAKDGAECLALAGIQKCNLHPCPVDCELQAWSGWSKCTAECGGGVQQRLKEVKQAMKYDGKPCGSTSESRACNTESCEKDCELTEWTKWSTCSKDCDGGTMKRQKFVKVAPEGAGKCADEWDPERLQYRECNMKRCQVPLGASVLHCNES